MHKILSLKSRNGVSLREHPGEDGVKKRRFSHASGSAADASGNECELAVIRVEEHQHDAGVLREELDVGLQDGQEDVEVLRGIRVVLECFLEGRDVVLEVEGGLSGGVERGDGLGVLGVVLCCVDVGHDDAHPFGMFN